MQSLQSVSFGPNIAAQYEYSLNYTHQIGSKGSGIIDECLAEFDDSLVVKTVVMQLI